MTRRLYTRREFAGLVAALPALRHLPNQTRAVKIGYCTPLKNVPAAKAAGFDYVELGTTEIAALSDEDFTAAARTLGSTGIATPVTNLFLPPTLKVTGPAIDKGAQAAYVSKAFDRLARIGVGLVVFGSGGARRVPEDFPADEAFAQLVDFGRRAAGLARQRNITIAVEPLRRQETNIINSAAEGLNLVEAVAETSFQLMVDFYHLASEHESPDIVVQARDHLRHVHVANPNGRVFPLAWDEFEYEPFFTNLRRIGYDQRISVEASTQDLNGEAPRSIALLRQHASGA
jgi:D-psicose/D-tagatose/L-ribulose 3-epimerase